MCVSASVRDSAAGFWCVIGCAVERMVERMLDRGPDCISCGPIVFPVVQINVDDVALRNLTIVQFAPDHI